MKDKITLYRMSLANFIEDYFETHKSNRLQKESVQNIGIIPIITLTIIGNLYKHQHKTSIHGYYIAFLIQILNKNNNIDISIIKLIDEQLVLLSQQISSDKLVNINCLAHDILFKYVNFKDTLPITELCRIAVLFGWIFGCGVLNREILTELESAGGYLGELMELSESFDKNSFNDQFDRFVKSKQKFIEIMVKNDLFSDTIRIIVNMLEEKIDNSLLS